MTSWVIHDKTLSNRYNRSYNDTTLTMTPGMSLSVFEDCCGYMILSDFDTYHNSTITAQESRLFFMISILREEYKYLTGVMAVVTNDQFKQCPGLEKLLADIGFTLMVKPKSKETRRTLYTYVWLNKSRRNGKN